MYNISPLVPNPTVVITSTPVSPVRPVGSAITLTCACTVDLSQLVDVPATVNAQLLAPAGEMITNSVMENTTTYSSRAVVNPFGREQSLAQLLLN